jgi:hypothetical protein
MTTSSTTTSSTTTSATTTSTPLLPTIRARNFVSNRPPVQLQVALPLVCPELGCRFSLSAATGGFSAFCLNGHSYSINVSLNGLGPSRLHIPFTPALVSAPPAARPVQIRRPTPAPTPIRRRVPPRPAADIIVVSDEDDHPIAFNRSNNRPGEPMITVSTMTLAAAVECAVCYDEVLEVGSHSHGSTFTCIRCWRRVSSCPICRSDFLLI